jgi:hypothetical protein
MVILARAREQHRHHGLIFKIQSNASVRGLPLADAAAGLAAVPMEGPGGRSGTFHLWHNSCREMPMVGVHTDTHSTGSTSGCHVLLGASDEPMAQVPEVGLTLLECLLALPGMMDYLALQGIASD